MRIALFSDVHGHLRTVLHIMRNWQIAHNQWLDAALLAGDVGCYPDPGRFDAATRRWANLDPEEAGFALHFVRPSAVVEELLSGEDTAPAVRAPLLFVPGNHEDHEFIRQCSGERVNGGSIPGTFPVDCYGVVHGIHDGDVVHVEGADGTALRVGGLWGVEQAPAGAPYRMSERAVNRLLGRGQGAIDLLLTHDAPLGAVATYGSGLVTQVLRACLPAFHLFGHVHPEDGCHAYEVAGVRTRCWLLEDVGFGKSGKRSLAGSMAVLTWDGAEGHVSLVEDEWLGRMRLATWPEVMP